MTGPDVALAVAAYLSIGGVIAWHLSPVPDPRGGYRTVGPGVRLFTVAAWPYVAALFVYILVDTIRGGSDR